MTILISLNFANIAFAKDISIFLVDFSDSSTKLKLIEQATKETNKSDMVLAIFDARSVRIVAYFASEHRMLGSESAKETILAQIDQNYKYDEKINLNLPMGLSLVNEIILGHYATGDAVNIFLVNALKHNGRKFAFENGFPNDGFLTLKDSDFALIRPLPSKIKSSVYVLEKSNNLARNEYLRFSYHLAQVKLGGELKSFSFEKSEQALNFQEPILHHVKDLEIVSGSDVVNGVERPRCEVEDSVEVVQKADRLSINVQNISRANSYGNFELSVGNYSEKGQFFIDSNGAGAFNVKRIPGKGILNVSDCDGICAEDR